MDQSSPDTGPPHDAAAERAVLGACLLNPDVIPKIRDIIADDDWYEPRHITVWTAITTLHDLGTRPDALTVADHLTPANLHQIGGGPYLHDLIESVPTVANATHYARQVRDAAILRQIATLGIKLTALADHRDLTRAAETLERARTELEVASSVAEHGLQAGSSVLAPLTVTELLDTPAGDDQWLFEPVWPGDAYGVIAAEDKAGKSWTVIDMAVAVATGRSWMGVYHARSPGGVLLFAGEGGRRNLARRLNAVAEYHRTDPHDLDLTTVLRVPHLTDPQHLADVAHWLDRHPARLVILDPLYLAARGAKGSDLYAMGEHLEGIQHVCQQAGAALVIVTHFNKTGAEKNGKSRITGVGPGAWGRVLATAAVEAKHYTDGRSVVTLSWDFIGGEIPDTEINIRRTVWSDDPANLSAPLHYHVEKVPDSEMEVATGVGKAHDRVLAVLRGAERPLTVRQIGDRLAETGHPLKHRTIQNALSELPDVESSQVDGRGTLEFWIKGRF